MTPDLSTWLPAPNAAARLGISERDMRRRATEGEIERRHRPRAGKKAEAVYNPDDVERLVAAKHPAHVMPAVKNSGDYFTGAELNKMAEPFPPAARELMAWMERVATAIGQRAETRAIAAPPIPRGPWLTIRQASARSGLSVGLLRRLVRGGKLPCIQDRVWKVREGDLDNLDIPAALAGLSKLQPMTAKGGV